MHFIDVLIASLTDTLSENPELVSAAKESLTSPTYTERQQLLRKILSLGVNDKSDKVNQLSLQLSGNNLKHAPIGFGKYNTS